MTYKPETVSEIQSSIEASLRGKVSKLTNFTERSFNFILTRAVSSHFREIEIKLLASELSAYIEYAGGPITEEDLRQLGIEDVVNPEDLEPYMKDENLENLVEVVGISRDQGSYATGFVDISVDLDDRVTIPEETILSTSPDEEGQTIDYQTTESRSIGSGEDTAIDVPVRAVERGTEYNIPANSIVRFESPPIGVTGISDSTAMDGGEDVETNDELRERAKTQIANEPTGGTVKGLRGFIIDEVPGVTDEDIGITELFERTPTLVEVTVDGGSEATIKDAIEQGRPVGVKHELLRPETIEISVDAQVLGDGIDEKFVSSEVESYLLDELRVGGNFYIDNIIRTIMQADDDILNITEYEIIIDAVSNERHIFDADKSTQKYSLDYVYDGNTVTVTDSDDNVFDEGVDYDIVDDSGDGLGDTIEWLGADTPNDRENFFIDYTVSIESNEELDEEHIYQTDVSDDITYDTQVSEYRLSEIPLESSIVVDDSSTTYTKGTDYELINSAVDKQSDKIVYNSGRDTYELNRSAFPNSLNVYIPDGASFTQGNDYQVIDDDGDGIEETIEWLDAGSSPADNEEWVAEYDVNNGLPQTINWLDSGSTPSNGDTFTVTYEQQVYNLNYDIATVTPELVSCNCPDSTYEYETDFDFVDSDGESVKDSIRWLSGGSNPSDGVPFYVTYLSEGDIELTEQQKIEPSSVTITEQ